MVDKQALTQNRKVWPEWMTERFVIAGKNMRRLSRLCPRMSSQCCGIVGLLMADQSISRRAEERKEKRK